MASCLLAKLSTQEQIKLFDIHETRSGHPQSPKMPTGIVLLALRFQEEKLPTEMAPGVRRCPHGVYKQLSAAPARL